jgi:pyridoxal phosphate enzyme (YggS family)
MASGRLTGSQAIEGDDTSKYMHKIPDNLAQVLDSVHSAAKAAGRSGSDITLLAVSKTKPAQAIQAAHDAGQRHFGENYVQEALQKMNELGGLDITWHFIGPIQSNKTPAVASHFSWVHSVDRLKIARRLSDQRPENMPPLNVCLQVNIDAEASKSGMSPEEALASAAEVADLPRIKLRGLMAIPDPAKDPRDAFARLRQLAEEIQARTNVKLDTLSMGMSADLREAIAEGATIVRVGTAIFGER